MQPLEAAHPGLDELLLADVGAVFLEQLRRGPSPAAGPVEERGLGIVENRARPAADDAHLSASYLIVVRLWILEQVSFLFAAVGLMIRWDSEPAARYHEDTKATKTFNNERRDRRDRSALRDLCDLCVKCVSVSSFPLRWRFQTRVRPPGDNSDTSRSRVDAR